MRARPHRDVDHLVGRRHFEIERLLDLGLEARDIVVADVPAILAQMRRDAVGAGLDREPRGPHRIGMPSAARVADGGDVVDVDAQAKMRNGRHVLSLMLSMNVRRYPVTRSAAATTFLARNCAMIALRCLRS